MRIEINQCPVHKKFYAIALEYGNGTGLRLTPSKCCGQWRQIASWQVTKHMADEIVRELNALDTSEAVDA